MKAAPCSWRVKISSIEEVRKLSTTSRFSSPGTPKTRSTPSFSNAATSRSEPLGIIIPLLFIRPTGHWILSRSCSSFAPPPAVMTLFQVTQQHQNHRHGNSPPDAGCNLSKRHELHPVGRRQNRDVASAALPAVACIHDRGFDRVHLHEAANDKTGRHDGDDGRDDGDDIGEMERCDQLVPGCQSDTDGK